MAEYIQSEMKVVKLGEEVGIKMPEVKATVKFDVCYIPSTYIVEIDGDGNWVATIKEYR